MSEVLTELRSLLDGGGPVMPALLLCSAVLWYALGWRLLTLRRGDRRPVEQVWTEAATGRLPRGSGRLVEAVAAVAAVLPELGALSPGEREERVRLATAGPRAALESQRALVTSLVVAAPLLGLLGTVDGMIETFDALGQQALFRQGGGIAGGIAQALLTTQLGLCVAIPGTLAARLLDRREARLRADLSAIEDLAARGAPCAA